MLVVTSEEEVTRTARDFVTCIETFQVEMHKSNTATPTKPSKSVVVHTPATCLENVPLKSPMRIRNLANGTSETICYVRSCVHLGAAIINEKLCDEEETDKRTLKTTQLLGMLRQNMMASKDIWPEVKQQIFLGMIMPTLLDGAEHWVMGEAKRQELNVVFNSMVRSALRSPRA
jgi:hypothetical protein